MSTKLRILVVDDNTRMTRTLVDILNFIGYLAQEAISGPEALERMEAAQFDCLLTDIKMPGMNGIELHRAVQEIQPGLPVVLMSAYAGEELVKEGLKEGAIAVLTKPLDMSLFLGLFASIKPTLRHSSILHP